MTSLRYYRLAILLGCLSLSCAKRDQPQSARTESASSTVPINEPAATSTPLSGPRLMSDSNAKEPFFSVAARELLLHLPPSMVRELNDSLPGFAPIQRSLYEPSLVQFADARADDSREIGQTVNDSLAFYALSAAIGDFDGDSTSDVAILGNSRDSTAAVFVLAPSRVRQQPRVIFIRRPRAADHLNRVSTYLNLVRAGPVRVFDEDDKSPPFQLKTDGVEFAYFEKGAEVFFLEHGVVQSLITSD
jgi:hypothetical protein